MSVEEPEAVELLAAHPRWRWREGMADTEGRRIVDTDLVAAGALPNLADAATAGLLLEVIDELGVLTDVVRQLPEWIVAVQLTEGLQGYAAGTLGEAAAWALLAVWGERPSQVTINA